MHDRQSSASSVPLCFKDFGFSDLARFRQLSNRRQHVPGVRVVAEGLAHVDEKIFVSRRKDKAPAQLQRVFAQPMLLVPGSLRAFARLHVVAADKVEQGSMLEPHGFVGLALFVDQQRKLDAGFLAEKPGITRIAQPHRRQARTLLAELIFKFAQLRDVLPTEDSTVVAEKYQHRRAFRP